MHLKLEPRRKTIIRTWLQITIIAGIVGEI